MIPAYMKTAYEAVTNEYETALARAGRHDRPLLLAAVKYATDGELTALQELGIAAVGENRVQQWQAHKPLLRSGLPVHFIGSLQKNKVNELFLLPTHIPISSIFFEMVSINAFDSACSRSSSALSSSD